MKERVAVLMGGVSCERDISLLSGKAVTAALTGRGYQVIPFDVNSQGELEEKLREGKIDVAFVALHGRFGEDGSIQRLLEKLEIPYTGSGVRASHLALNKIEAKKIFQKRDIPTPPFFIFEKTQSYQSLFKKLPFEFPWVVKPEAEGSSLGLSIVKTKEELDKAIKAAFSYGQRLLIEKYINGKEITVGILDECPLPIIEVVSKRPFYDYQAKYTKGISRYLVPASINLDLYCSTQKMALAAHQALRCTGMSRVDMKLDEQNQPYVLEINTIPGLTELSLLPKAAQAIGVSFADLCSILIKLAKIRRYSHEEEEETEKAI